MSRTITAFFDSRNDAEQARERLAQSGIDAGRAQIIDQSSSNAGMGGTDGGGGSSDGQSFWASLKSAFMPDEDRYAYEEGMRRGGYLLCAQVDENQTDEAFRILDQEGTVDFDTRQDEWRSQGWSGFTDSPQQSGSSTNGRSGTVEEERIPLVEEELRVGKREVARGGARVRSYIRETPVSEHVNLREEHVSVERRPVDQPIGVADLDNGDLLRDRTIEMSEMAEEAVVAKQARVAEEVVVKKTAEERTEQIQDTVRRTEVEIDEDTDRREDRSAFGFRDETNASSTTGSAGFRDRDPQVEESGYSGRIDKSGF